MWEREEAMKGWRESNIYKGGEIVRGAVRERHSCRITETHSSALRETHSSAMMERHSSAMMERHTAVQ